MWPISNTQTFVNYFQSNGLTQSPCEPLAAAFEADAVELCVGNDVHFTDMSEGVPITWEWTFEGGNPSTSTEENPMVTYDNAGVFDVSLTVHDGVATTTTEMPDYITVDDCTGISEPLENGTKIFPNPARDKLNLTSVEKIIKIRIFNNLGQVVLVKNVNESACQLNTSDLESGIYLLKLETENNFILKQIVIQ